MAAALLAAAPAAAARAASVTVTVGAAQSGPPVPADFLGLSLEVKSLAQTAGFADSGNLVELMRSIGPGLLRFGGVTADTQVAWSDDGLAVPPWVTKTLSPPDFAGIARLASATGWRVLLTVNFGHYDPQAAAREVLAAHAALGDSLAGIELGNEPDSYAPKGLRPLPWGFAEYQPQVEAYRAAIAAVAPGVPLAGPDVSSGTAHLAWVDSDAVVEQPALLTAHYYPFSACAASPPVAGDLLSPGVRQAESRALAGMAFIAAARGLPLRVDETNNASCGGEPGVSNTFSSALWAVDFLTAGMQAGLAGINFHGNVANPQGYTPLAAASPDALSAGALTAQPEWYALLLAHQLLGDRPLSAGVRLGGRNATATALLGAHGQLHIVLVDDQPSRARALAFTLRVPRRYAGAAVLRLTAPSRLSTSGVELGGQPVSPEGSWSAPAAAPLLPVRGGRLTVRLAPSSAALITVYPRHASITSRGRGGG